MIAEVGRAAADRRFRVKEGAEARELNPEQREVVFSMVSDPVGVYDEGLRQVGNTTYRVLNGPGRSDNAEIEALQRLWIDLETFLPGRYQFAYAFPGYGDYEYQLKALAESFVCCDGRYAAMTDAAGLPKVTFDVTYMRLKGIVPPSSEPRAAR